MSLYLPVFAEMDRARERYRENLEKADDELRHWWASMSDTEKLALKRFISQIGKELEIKQLESKKKDLEKEIKSKGPIETNYLKGDDLYD